MSNDLTPEKIQEFEDITKNTKPVPIKMQMHETGFDFITSHLMILNKEKYRIEQGIQIVNKNSVLDKYQARVIYSDNSTEIINLREVR